MSKQMLLFSWSLSCSKICNNFKIWFQHGLRLFRIMLMEIMHNNIESDVWDVNILITITYKTIYTLWKHPRQH